MTQILHNPEIPFLGVCPSKMKTHVHKCLAILFIIGKTKKQSKCPPTHGYKQIIPYSIQWNTIQQQKHTTDIDKSKTLHLVQVRLRRPYTGLIYIMIPFIICCRKGKTVLIEK